MAGSKPDSSSKDASKSSKSGKQQKKKGQNRGGGQEVTNPHAQEISVQPKDVPELRLSLAKGGGVRAAYDVGQFREGFVILAGGDLDLESLDVIGLQDGDLIDRALRGVVQEALAAVADEGITARLYMMPSWFVEKGQRGGLLGALCCRRQRKKYQWNRRWTEQWFGMYLSIESCILRCLYDRSNRRKKYDVFVSAQNADTDIAHWMVAFLQHRSMAVYHQEPCKDAREMQAKPESSGNPEDYERAAVKAVSCMEWLKRRQEALKDSRVLVVVLSADALENPWVVLDSCWAWAAGIPILPVARGNPDNHMAEWKKELPCIFSLKLGATTAGPGASRRTLAVKVQRAVVKGLRAARGKKTKNGTPLPDGAADRFVQICHRLQIEVEEHNVELEKEEKGEDLAIYGLTQVNDAAAEFETLAMMRDNNAKDPNAKSAKGALNKKNQKVRKKRAAHHEGAMAAAEETKEGPEGLPIQLEERIYGVIALLAINGDNDRRIAIDGTDAMHQLARGEKGAACVAEFGGVDVLVRMCKLACARRQGQTPGHHLRGRPNRISRLGILRMSSGVLGRFSNRPSVTSVTITRRSKQSLVFRLFASVSTMRTSGLGGMGSTEDLSDAIAIDMPNSVNDFDRKASSEWRSAEGKSTSCCRCCCSLLCCCWCCCRRRGREPQEEEEASPRHRRPSVGSVSSQPVEQRSSFIGSLRAAASASRFRHSLNTLMASVQRAAAPKEDNAERQMLEDCSIGENCFAALKNIACRDATRKDILIQTGAITAALRALRAFRIPAGDAVRKQASCVLRNLSHGADTSLVELPRDGMFDLAEEELQNLETNPAVKRHVLAMVQNLVMEDGVLYYFMQRDGAIEGWMDLCARAMQHGVKHREPRVAQQALAALGNFALLRQEQLSRLEMPGGHDEYQSVWSQSNRSNRTGNESSRTFRPMATGSTAKDAREDANSDAEAERELVEVVGEPSSGDADAAIEAAQGSSAGVSQDTPVSSRDHATERSRSASSNSQSRSAHSTASDASGSWGAWSAAMSAIGEEGGEEEEREYDEEVEEEEWEEDEEDSWNDDDRSAGIGAKIVDSWGDEAPAGLEAEVLNTQKQTKRSAQGGSARDGRLAHGEKPDDADAARSSSGSDGTAAWSDARSATPASEELAIVVARDDSSSQAPTENQLLARSYRKASEKVPMSAVDSILKVIANVEKMPKHKAASLTIAGALSSLCNFAQDQDLERYLGKQGAVQSTLKAIKRYAQDELHLQALRLLWNMTSSRTNQVAFMQSNGLPFVLLAISVRRKPQHAPIKEQGCGVLRNLSTGPAVQKKRIWKAGAVPVLVRIFHDCKEHPAACMQASAALRILAEGAPPVVEEICREDGVDHIVDCIAVHSKNIELAGELLHLLEFVLSCASGQLAFSDREGHMLLLQLISKAHFKEIHMRACKAIACALAIVPGSAGSHDETGSQNQDDLDDNGANETRGTKQEVSEAPRFKMRANLLEMGALDEIRHVLEQWQEDLEVMEAAAACLLNLLVDVGSENTGLKPDLGRKVGLILNIAADMAASEDTREEGKEFVRLVLKILGSLALDRLAAMAVYKLSAIERAIEWMRFYHQDADLQQAACLFITNMSAATKLRFRQAIIEGGGLKSMCVCLDAHRRDAQVVVTALWSIHNMGVSGISFGLSEQIGLPKLVMSLLEMHAKDPGVVAAGFAALRNAALDDALAVRIFEQDVCVSIMRAFDAHRAAVAVAVQGLGLLRNLVGATCAEATARQLWTTRLPPQERENVYRANGLNGYRLVLETFGKHVADVHVVEQGLAVLANIASLDGEHIVVLAEEMFAHNESPVVRNAITMHIDSPMAQAQGFQLLIAVLSRRREMVSFFNGLCPHVHEMMFKYKNTPIAVIGDLLLEHVY